jgi:DNA-binding NarL/FixJ family response regulator
MAVRRAVLPTLASGGVADAVSRESSDMLAALDAALDAMGAPAFVVGSQGELLHASRSARTLLESDSDRVLGALADAAAGKPSIPALDLTPVRADNGAPGFLITVRRLLPDEARIKRAVAVAARRWKLTPRQIEVLDLVGRGLTNASIADELRIRQTTVEFHLCGLFDKAGVNNRATLIARLLEL